MSDNKLSKEERDQMIAVLSIQFSYSREYFKKRTDQQIIDEYLERALKVDE